MTVRSVLRPCVICEGPVFARPYQANSARTCSPTCAKTLAAQEHPELIDRAWRHRSSDGKLPEEGPS
jgi:hypothetical protein